MIPTLQQIYDASRDLCQDSEIAGGQRWLNSKLRQYLQASYSDFFAACSIKKIPRTKQKLYFVLEPFTAVMTPAAAAIANCGELADIRERVISNVDDVLTITSLSPGTGEFALPRADQCLVGTGPVLHGFTSGDRVTVWGISGVTDDINDEWMIKVVDDTTFLLMGCTAVLIGAGPWSQGSSTRASVYKSTVDFGDMNLRKDLQGLTMSGGAMGFYSWRQGKARFAGSSSSLQLELSFYLSGALPAQPVDGVSADASVGIDDSLNYLAYATAARAIQPVNSSMSKEYAVVARGEDGLVGELARAAGALGNLLSPMQSTLQRLPVDRPGYGAEGARARMRQRTRMLGAGFGF